MAELQWVVDAYTLVFAGLLLLAGALGDRYGRRRTLLGGLAVFGVRLAAGPPTRAASTGSSSPARSWAPGPRSSCRRRSRSLISVFTDTRERAMAIGIWAATAGLGVALGPVVGGFLLDHFWWGSIFIVNVPLIAIALVAGARLLPESRDPVARRIDWTGAALSGVGLVAFVWAIIEAPRQGLDVRARPRRRRDRRGRRWSRSWPGSAASRSRCSTSACSRTRASPRPAPRSWCCSSPSSGSSSCRRSTCSSSSATRRRPPACASCPTPGR